MGSPAALGAPIHQPADNLTLDSTKRPVEETPTGELNRACGAAVDSEGYLYVTSAGKGYIDIFKPTSDAEAPWEYSQTSIPNAKEPCSLAVDGSGDVYVAETKLGEARIVKYSPTEYPFAGPPSYGLPVVIDEGGGAGIAVDPFDNRLYVTKGDHVDVYDSKGNLGINEMQRVNCFECTGGTYTLSFGESGPTAAIEYKGPAVEVQKALEELSSIGKNNVSVSGDGTVHSVSFVGKLAHTDVDMLEGSSSGLIGGSSRAILISEQEKGFAGTLGEGELTDASGVAAYTYKGTGVFGEQGDRYLYVADRSGDQVKILSSSSSSFETGDIRELRLRNVIDGVDEDRNPATPPQAFGFGPAGAMLVADPGQCPPIEQACTAGHLFFYDDAHRALNEFDAAGRFLTQTDVGGESFEDARPTAIAIDRSGTIKDGTLYITSGSGSASTVKAFYPLVTPSRTPLPKPLSHELKGAQAVTTDRAGNIYVATENKIYVFPPQPGEAGPKGEPEPIAIVEDPQLGTHKDLAVDVACNLYVLENGAQVTYFVPSSCPPSGETTYTRQTPPVVTRDSFSRRLPSLELKAIGINPSNDHLFVAAAPNNQIVEVGPADKESPMLNTDFAQGLGLTDPFEIAISGDSGNVYLASYLKGISIIARDGSEVLARITGSGSLTGPFGNFAPQFSVDQTNGHLVTFRPGRQAIEEYDGSGAFVGQFVNPEYDFQAEAEVPVRIAVDNSSGNSNGRVYLAYDQPAPASPDVWAFGPLSFGEPPLATTGLASGIGDGQATLNGRVDPRGFELDDCHFTYDAAASPDPPTSVPCSEELSEIGSGAGPVPVHTDIKGIDQGIRYHFRLHARNAYGEGAGAVGLFGPPEAVTGKALPILYDEASLRGEVDPSGLTTKYFFEYGTSTAYGETTPVAQLGPDDGRLTVQAALTDLAEATEYHFRVVAENDASMIRGSDQVFTTLQRAAEQACQNDEYRIGLSANLADCRAYELVTPADTRGLQPGAAGFGSAGRSNNNWLVRARGVGRGERLVFFTTGTLPGFDGNGLSDGYLVERDPGAHPPGGWQTTLFGPTYQESPDVPAVQHGVGPDQRYSFWRLSSESFKMEQPSAATLPDGEYLRTPTGFEAVGQGSLGADLDAEGRFVSAGGMHIVFSSKAHLEGEDGNKAAPKGTEALYSRSAGDSRSEVVSVKPDGSAFGNGEDATYVAATDDGAAVVFEVGGTLYLHRAGQTSQIASPPNTFAGIAEDGKRVFYANLDFSEASATPPADLFVCDTAAGPCDGSGSNAAIEIAKGAIFVNVSADGSTVYVTSKEVLDVAEEGTPGEDNLYMWDAASKTTSFIAVLDSQDLIGFDEFNIVNLGAWTSAVGYGLRAGRAKSPTRSTPSGKTLIVQSHAQLTSYDNNGFAEVYRYEVAAAPGEQLVCLSCNPTGSAATGDASLQTPAAVGTLPPVKETSLIVNISDDGQRALYQSPDRLVPEDANEAQDVYEWVAKGVGACDRPGGCIALISSGQGEGDSHLFGMSADGRDVFFSTNEKLLREDISGSSSIYDARMNGGIPAPPTHTACQGDACQGQGSVRPELPSPASAGILGKGNLTTATHASRCSRLARAAAYNRYRATGLRHRSKQLRRRAVRHGGSRRSRGLRRRSHQRTLAAHRRSRRARRFARRAKRCRFQQRANADRRTGQ